MEGTGAEKDGRLFVHRIDGEDVITGVNPEWTDFARENEAPELAGSGGDGVVGRALWDFISDKETRHLYRLMLGKVRSSGVAITLPFRCDSPGVRRFMEMTLDRAGPGGEVEFRCVLLREERREGEATLLDRLSERSSEFVKVCSWCRRVYVGESGWKEPEDAVRELNLFDAPALPQLTHGVCPDCTGRAFRKIDERMEGKGE